MFTTDNEITESCSKDTAPKSSDLLRARECAWLSRITASNAAGADVEAEKDPALIQAIAHAQMETLSYFAEEFEITDPTGEKRVYLYPYLGDVIDQMLKEARCYHVEILLQAARHHNQKVYWQLKEMQGDARQEENDSRFAFAKDQNLVGYERHSPRGESFLSNLIQIKGESEAYNIRSIYEEVNDWREKVIQLGKTLD